MVLIDRCVYCENIDKVAVWEKTQELVCYACRVLFLEEEFSQSAVCSHTETVVAGDNGETLCLYCSEEKDSLTKQAVEIPF